MTIFDLSFLILLLVAICTTLAAVWYAVTGDFGRFSRTLLRLLAGAAVYMAVVIEVSLLSPRRIIKIGVPQCFDDWCIAIDGFSRTSEGPWICYGLNLRLVSRARRVSQRERNIAVYLTDARGRRFDSVRQGSDVPYDVILKPEQAIAVTRSFRVPAESQNVGAVITHEGGLPIGWFIIGYDSWFRKPPIGMLR